VSLSNSCGIGSVIVGWNPYRFVYRQPTPLAEACAGPETRL
jgi:hypothetical protein